MFAVKNFNKSFHGKKILNGLSFELPLGSVGLFLGSSGAGKSTLFRALNNLETLDSGEALLSGEILNLSEVSRKHQIGIVFQHFNLFEHLTVNENITLALTKLKKMKKADANDIANSLLARYGLSDKGNAYVHQLSGGQKQRAAIARTIALNPQIVCLDEPTSALDPLLTGQIALYIQEMAAEGRVVLVSTHDTHLIEKLEGTAFFLRDGVIADSTAIKELRKT